MRDRSDIDVREIMSAGEDVTRTIIGRTLDSISSSAAERSAKWRDSDDAIRHLQRVRDAINNGEELTWAVVDFWLQQLPDPEGYTVNLWLSDEDHDALAEAGESHGTTAAGYLTMLAQKFAQDRRVAAERAQTRQQPKVLLVAASAQQADAFIMRNAEAFAGWSIVVHNRSQQTSRALRGMQVHLTVIIGEAPVPPGLHDELLLVTRAGDNPTVVTAANGPDDRFYPNDVIRSKGA